MRPFWIQICVNALSLMIGMATARLLSAVALIVTARQIGPAAAGQYSSSLALASLTVVLCSLGLDEWLLYRGSQNSAELRVNFTATLALKLFLGPIWLVGLCLSGYLLDSASLPTVLIFWAALSVWLEDLAKSGWAVFKIQSRNHLNMILMSAFQGVLLLIVLWLNHRSVTQPQMYMGGRALVAAFAAGTTGALAIREVGTRLVVERLWPTVKDAFPFAISIALAMVYGRADLTIIAFKLGRSAAGVYGPAITLTNALFLIPGAFYGVLVPMLSRRYIVDSSQARRLSIWMLFPFALAGIVLGAVLKTFAPFIINTLYGPDFAASADVLAILGVVLVLRFPIVALASVLVARGQQSFRVRAQLVSAALNVGLNLLIVESYNVQGVAIVYILSEIVLFFGYLGIFLSCQREREKDIISC